jgi:hypothetical protein
MTALGMDSRNKDANARMAGQVRTALIRQQKNGTVVSEAGPNPGPWQAWFWRIAE